MPRNASQFAMLRNASLMNRNNRKEKREGVVIITLEHLMMKNVE
jgi:hypothetical protein